MKEAQIAKRVDSEPIIEPNSQLVAKPEDELADWHEGAKLAAGDACDGAKHCACVAWLRRELAEARNEANDWNEAAGESQQLLEKMHRERVAEQRELATARATVERLRTLHADLVDRRRKEADRPFWQRRMDWATDLIAEALGDTP